MSISLGVPYWSTEKNSCYDPLTQSTMRRSEREKNKLASLNYENNQFVDCMLSKADKLGAAKAWKIALIDTISSNLRNRSKFVKILNGKSWKGTLRQILNKFDEFLRFFYAAHSCTMDVHFGLLLNIANSAISTTFLSDWFPLFLQIRLFFVYCLQFWAIFFYKIKISTAIEYAAIPVCILFIWLSFISAEKRIELIYFWV